MKEWWSITYGEGIFESNSVLFTDEAGAQAECDRLVNDMEYDYAYAYAMAVESDGYVCS